MHDPIVNPVNDASCPSCGLPVDPALHDTCPKCDRPIRGVANRHLLVEDVAHDGEDWESAARKIEKAVDHALFHGHAGVKIIHGHGASTGRSLIAPRAIALIKKLAERHGGRFTRDRHNPGAHLIWFNR